MKNITQNLMRMSKFILIFLFLGGVIASCSKDKDEDSSVSQTEFAKNYFDIGGNADFNGRPLPSSNSQSLQVMSINGNSTILAGGSNLIHLSGSENATEVIVGVKDKKGYFTVPMTAGKGTANRGVVSMTDLRLLIGQEASGTFSIAFAVGDGMGNFSEYQYLVVELMQAGTGLLQVSLSWDQLNDVDLHLIEPNGEEIYYGNRVSSNGGQLDVDSNAACSIDGINNENIYYEDNADVTIQQGEYEVLVDLWSNCDIGPNTNYTVVVYYGGNIIATSQGSNPHSGVLTPSTTDMISVMKFNIQGPPANRVSGNQNESLPNLFKFSFDENNKVFENFNAKK